MYILQYVENIHAADLRIRRYKEHLLMTKTSPLFSILSKAFADHSTARLVPFGLAINITEPKFNFRCLLGFASITTVVMGMKPTLILYQVHFKTRHIEQKRATVKVSIIPNHCRRQFSLIIY
jgi:hypothetical protein